ncbi:hypothetical protein C8R46DRAFT_1026093 [Mycena filopes]|nr:hypothetical protein C8R46DRAFT_1026093 [Mycena filopes]
MDPSHSPNNIFFPRDTFSNPWAPPTQDNPPVPFQTSYGRLNVPLPPSSPDANTPDRPPVAFNAPPTRVATHHFVPAVPQQPVQMPPWPLAYDMRSGANHAPAMPPQFPGSFHHYTAPPQHPNVPGPRPAYAPGFAHQQMPPNYQTAPPPLFHHAPYTQHVQHPYGYAAHQQPLSSLPSSVSGHVAEHDSSFKVITLNMTGWTDKDLLDMDKNNWSVYSQRVVNHLAMHGAADKFLDPNISPPSFDMYPRVHAVWLDNDRVIRAFLTETCALNEREHFAHCRTAAEICGVPSAR